MNHTPEQERLFFALWPDEGVRAALADQARQLLPAGVRPIADHNLHMTLVFLGDVARQCRTCLEAAADTIRSPAFALRLDRTGYFSRPQVYWLGAREVPPGLVQLVEALRAAQSSCGMSPESRAFRPHVTLARKVRKPPPDAGCGALTWPVDRFALVRSRTLPEGSRYEPQRTWLLHGE